MVQISKLKFCDKSKSKNPEDWFLSVSHKLDNEEDLLMFFALFNQSINEHFEICLKAIPPDLIKNYIYKKECIITFRYNDLSIALSTLSSMDNSNLFNFNPN